MVDGSYDGFGSMVQCHVPGSGTDASAVSYDNSEHNDAPERVFAIRLG